MLDVPCVMVLMCPLINRDAWDMASLSHMKAYGQSTLSSASSTSLWATSSRELKQAWWGCAHTAMRPKILLHSVAMLDTNHRNAMSCQGFSTFPHAPSTERVFSCACMITCTWKLSTTRQKSCEPHLAFITVPTNWHLWRGMQSCSLWSAMEEKGSAG